MNVTHLPLNAMRAFLVSAKHLNFTKAAVELCVTQAAVSQQVKMLEAQLGVSLFIRQSRGINLTEEGIMLLPVVKGAFENLSEAMDMLMQGIRREVVSVGVVGTFAVNWLLPRLADFQARYPLIDLRISTHNNKADPVAEGLDYLIRFGKGSWHATEATALFPAPLTALCPPDIGRTITAPKDVLNHTLLRSYQPDEWQLWLQEAKVVVPKAKLSAIVFDSSIAMVEAAMQGYGVALAPPAMFQRQLAEEKLVQPFDIYLHKGGYWLTRLHGQHETPGQLQWKAWLLAQAGAGDPASA
ncbi:LysR family transcriptional regulator [Photobacterium sp. 1_MG-2023]|uniref:LysR family transcriptional regulator n=1 Tax=Photobacterium sp. 1_MG-2023 TaxID=3062646 RepID=UPI0026E27211|nr:LysR family transcriptional regulator [Photobacterium sp. 1_MG-2023]MDO6705095.1 LysR family transcriptional regulator [Photobacterium sp. 1_MG-2023]